MVYLEMTLKGDIMKECDMQIENVIVIKGNARHVFGKFLSQLTI